MKSSSLEEENIIKDIRKRFRLQKENKTIKDRTHTATRRRGDIVTTPLYTYQQRHRHVPNETPNNVLMESSQDISMVHLHDVLLERHNDVVRGRSNNVPSVPLHDASSKSQMKHPMRTQWFTKVSQCSISTTFHYFVSKMSPVSPK